MTFSRKHVLYGIGAIAVAAIVVLAFRPAAIPVETAKVDRGAMTVTVDDKGWTRVRDRFVVTAPVAGNLHRIELREGDSIAPGQVIAVLEPLPLDAQQRQEVLARVAAAEASLREAKANSARAQSAAELARAELTRITRLAKDGVASANDLDQATTNAKTSNSEMEGAGFAVRTAQSELEVARAGLLALDLPRTGKKREIAIHSPVAGDVLRMPERSARVVAAGQELMEIGDPSRIELVIEVLSTDAVKIHRGDPVIVDDWGGGEPLHGKVRTIEPAGYTKISALGIEEQRVKVIADVDSPPRELGDQYRIEGRVVIWQSNDVVRVPISALARQGDEWSVFVADGDRARLRVVKIAHRNERVAEVLSGLEAGATVIVHPSNDLSEGARIAPTAP